MKSTKMALRMSGWLAIAASLGFGCTGQLPNSFRFAQQNQSFSVVQDFSTKIDMLFVVDNSSSMDSEQNKLRQGFTGFATKFMQPTWDIRVAVIPTDLYLANAAYFNYRNTVIPGTAGYTSSYVSSIIGTFKNPSWNTTLVDLNPASPTYKQFKNGLKYKDLVPTWDPSYNGNHSYAELVPGIHDGPIMGFCFELMNFFDLGAPQCHIRDQSAYNDISHCVSPNTAAGETGTTECVNTIENNSVHSGKAIISTMPPVGVPGDSTWTTNLVNDFIVNVTTGTVGSGSERGLGSVLQLLNDNETIPAQAFFRPNSLRAIVFVSDEDDQTQTYPSSVPVTYNPFTGYMCDLNQLKTSNPSATTLGQSGSPCCSDGTCRFLGNGTTLTCSPKTVDTLTYTIAYCPDPTQLVSVSTVKTQLDSFFLGLDGPGATNPNYLVISIVPLSGASIQSLQTLHYTDQQNANVLQAWEVDRGDRYLNLGQLVGNGSFSQDIATTDYSSIMTNIGTALIMKEGTFILARPATGQADMIVTIVHADGTSTVVQNSQYTINGTVLQITDLNFLLSMKSTDQISINYQPSQEIQ